MVRIKFNEKRLIMRSHLLACIVVWIVTVVTASTNEDGNRTAWTEKLKRRVAQQTSRQQLPSNGQSSNNPHHSIDQSPTNVTYFPFTVERDSFNLCTAVTSWGCRKIDRVHLTNQAKNKYLRDRKPIVLSNQEHGDSPVRAWKALQWNLWYWASKSLPVVNNVLTFDRRDTIDMSNNVFLVRDEEAQDTWDTDISNDSLLTSFSPYYVQDEMLLWDFLYDVGNKNEKPLPYNDDQHKDENTIQNEKEYCRFYSHDFQEMERMMKLTTDSDWKSLRIEEELGFPGEDDDLVVAPLFNMLYPGCSLQSRYSDYHTAKIQIFGRSRYYIVSPSKLAELFPFPSTSKHDHQLQINLYRTIGEIGQFDWRGTEIAQSLLASKDLLDFVELNPGETLFIPPGYAVLAEATTLSVTIDVLSPSREQILFMEALLTPLPLTRYADQNNKSPLPLSQDEKNIYTQVYLAHLISRIDGITSIGRYIRKLYKSRYSLQYPLDSLTMRSLANTFDCYKNLPEFHEKIVKSMHPVQVEKVATFVAKKFNDNLLLSSGTKWVLLGNYIEHVVRDLWEDKDLAWVPLYLTSCLDMDSKIKVVEEVEGPPVMKLNPIY